MKKNWWVIVNLLLIVALLPFDSVCAMTMMAQSNLQNERALFLDNQEANPNIEAPIKLLEEEPTTSNEVEVVENEVVEDTEETSEEGEENEVILEGDEEDKIAQRLERAVDEQDEDGFWLVDSAATLTKLLKDKKNYTFA